MPTSALRPKLADQLCFALYSASMAVGRAYKPFLDDLGITYPQYLVLSTLWERDGLTIGGVAETLGLESSTITPMVKRLATAGLIERRRNPQDDRQVRVGLTQSGRQMQERCACLGETLVSCSGMSPERLIEIAHVIREMRDTLIDHSGVSGIQDPPSH